VIPLLSSSALAFTVALSQAAPAREPAAGPAFPGGAALAAPVVMLLLLAGAALLLSRRRRAPTRRIQVLETTALGPKRSLVLARLGDELLLLGASDAGITLLRSQPSPRDALALAPPAEAPISLPTRAAYDTTAVLVDLAARLVPGRRRAEPTPRSPAFEALLVESDEDQELRRKLAAGRGGSVR
jgi:flagellar biogenesis protein FliO